MAPQCFRAQAHFIVTTGYCGSQFHGISNLNEGMSNENRLYKKLCEQSKEFILLLKFL